MSYCDKNAVTEKSSYACTEGDLPLSKKIAPPKKTALNVSCFKGIDEIVKCLPIHSSSRLARRCLNDRTYGRLAGSVGKTWAPCSVSLSGARFWGHRTQSFQNKSWPLPMWFFNQCMMLPMSFLPEPARIYLYHVRSVDVILHLSGRFMISFFFF